MKNTNIQPPCRRSASETAIGPVTIGGRSPVAVQTMTDTDTCDVEASLSQIGRIYAAGGRIVRLTVQGEREAKALRQIASRAKNLFPGIALAADVHFLPHIAEITAAYVDKVRINPGNYHDRGDDFTRLLEVCRTHGTAIRIGVNHGSLPESIVAEMGDTPRGMVAAAMKFLAAARDYGYNNVVVSIKSSNTRVMVQAYRLLTKAMADESMNYPLHLGVTEAGNGLEGRIKSAVGIGALLSDGIGDTIRVSLTEPPENEIPVGQILAGHFEGISSGPVCLVDTDPFAAASTLFNPYEYTRRVSRAVGKTGGDRLPVLWSELDDAQRNAAVAGQIALLSAVGDNPATEWRTALVNMAAERDDRPVILHRAYSHTDPEKLAIAAAADFGVMFIDGLADGIFIESTAGIPTQVLNDIALDILQASRARMSKTEFIACPGCGRTLYNLQQTLATIKEHTSHLKGLKIAVMGCIVNGPGEMADADYGYVGAAPGFVSLYRGKEPVRKNVPQDEALAALIELIKSDGQWTEPAQ